MIKTHCGNTVWKYTVYQNFGNTLRKYTVDKHSNRTKIRHHKRSQKQEPKLSPVPGQDFARNERGRDRIIFNVHNSLKH